MAEENYNTYNTIKEIGSNKRIEIKALGDYIKYLKSKYGDKSPNDFIAILKTKGYNHSQIIEQMKKVGDDVYGNLLGILSRVLVLTLASLRYTLSG